jgi:hypothetical protein
MYTDQVSISPHIISQSSIKFLFWRDAGLDLFGKSLAGCETISPPVIAAALSCARGILHLIVFCARFAALKAGIDNMNGIDMDLNEARERFLTFLNNESVHKNKSQHLNQQITVAIHPRGDKSVPTLADFWASCQIRCKKCALGTYSEDQCGWPMGSLLPF